MSEYVVPELTNARSFIEYAMKGTPTTQRIMLEEYDLMLDGKPTPRLDPSLKEQLVSIHQHFQRWHAN